LENLRLEPIKEISGHVKLPGSKSLSNRILLLAALAEGTTTVRNLLDSDDIRYMVGALKVLGIQLEENWEAGEMVVHGCGGAFPVQGAELFLGNAGTAMRPLTAAVAAAGRGNFVLDGVQRMRERPIQVWRDVRACMCVCVGAIFCCGEKASWELSHEPIGGFPRANRGLPTS